MKEQIISTLDRNFDRLETGDKDMDMWAIVVSPKIFQTITLSHSQEKVLTDTWELGEDEHGKSEMMFINSNSYSLEEYLNAMKKEYMRVMKSKRAN